MNNLEKKWSSVAKLKLKTMELEKKLSQVKESTSCPKCEGQGDFSSQFRIGDGLPKEPEKYCL
jgi:hypothetical protein